MEQELFYTKFWKYYLTLEKRFIDTDPYVTIDKLNYPIFSDEYCRLLLDICSGIDSLSVSFTKMLKEDCEEESKIKNDNIVKRIDTISKKYPQIKTAQVQTNRLYNEIYIVPFAKLELEDEKMVDWWRDYNNLKHDRAGQKENGEYHYQKANQKNVIHALAGFYLLCRLVEYYYTKSKKETECKSELFGFIYL